MLICKIDNLDCSFHVDAQYFHFCFIGDIDSVRQAAREVVFGLELLVGINASCEHVSEMNKSYFQTETAQININIDIDEFERLVLLFRYCNHADVSVDLGALRALQNGVIYHKELIYRPGPGQVQVYINKASAGFYLAQAKTIADGTKGILEIKDYALPDNMNFWLKKEIKIHARREKSTYDEDWQKNIFFFKLNPSDPKAKQQLINVRLNNIICLVDNMIYSNPENQTKRENEVGRGYLERYHNLQQPGKINNFADYLTKNPQHLKERFPLILAKDEKSFKLLANKYCVLKKQWHDLENASQKPRAITSNVLDRITQYLNSSFN